jgi:tetratricopeptide (TPR) repeat protein
MTTTLADRNPYVGPRPFLPEEQSLFFGRDQETEGLLALLVAHPVVLFYAQSGAGKTSLLNARLMPRLVEEDFEVLPVARVSGLLPPEVDPETVPNLLAYNALLSWMSPGDGPNRLVPMSLQELLAERSHGTDDLGEPCLRVVLFDQFEELFSRHPERWHDREAFFVQLADAIAQDPLLRVVLAIREDYLAQLDPYAHLLPGRLRARFRMERLHRRAALSAIEGPLRGTRRSFEEGVAETLVENLLKIRVEGMTGETVEVAGEFVEPVQLQVVCHRLWRELPANTLQISERELAAFGDVDQALSGFYEEAIVAASEETGIHQNDLRRWCETWLITSTGTRGIVHRGREQTEGLPNEAVDVLQGMHLIAAEQRAGARWYALTHDRFIGPIQASNERWNRQREHKSAQALSLLRQAQQHLAAGNYEQAMTRCQEFKSITSEIGEWAGLAFAHGLTGDIYIAQGQAEDAVNAYYKALDIQQGTGDLQGLSTTASVLVALLLYWERYEDALQIYWTALDAAQQSGSLQEMADTLAATGLDAAQNSGNMQGMVTALAAIGELFQQFECYDQAVQYFTKYIELSDEPDDLLGYEGRAYAYYYDQQYREAIADLAVMLDRDPASAHARFGRAQVFAEMGRYEKALVDLDRAAGGEGEDAVPPAWIHNWRGYALAGLKRYERALAEFAASIEAGPDNPWVYYNRARTYERMGELDKAAADYELALAKEEPRLNPARRERAQARLAELRGGQS